MNYKTHYTMMMGNKFSNPIGKKEMKPMNPT